MLATTKQVRNFARSINGGGFGYAGTFTDKSKRDEALRHVVFRLWSKEKADKLAVELKALLFIAGFENYEVRRTSSESNWATRTDGGEYVRVTALLG